MRRASIWLPPLGWSVIVLWGSGSELSAENTAGSLAWLLAFLGLAPSEALVELANSVLRTFGHLAAYAILAILYERAFRRTAALGPLRPWVAALGIVLVVAICDEIRQSFDPERDGEAADVLLDGLGGLAGCLPAIRRRGLVPQ